jgi:hypothetical protein
MYLWLDRSIPMRRCYDLCPDLETSIVRLARDPRWFHNEHETQHSWGEREVGEHPEIASDVANRWWAERGRPEEGPCVGAGV